MPLCCFAFPALNLGLGSDAKVESTAGRSPSASLRPSSITPTREAVDDDDDDDGPPARLGCHSEVASLPPRPWRPLISA
jgi:hypothetical protein